MSKRKAHVILMFVDIIAIVGVWIGYCEIDAVISGVSSSIDSVSFLNRIGLIFLFVGVPIIHVCSIFINGWPGYSQSHSRILKSVGIIFGVFLIIGTMLISVLLQSYVEKAGYHYCPKASRRMTFSTNLVFTRNMEICERLVEND